MLPPSQVTDRDGAFLADDDMLVSECRPGMSPFRCALQAGREASFYKYTLNNTEINDLCEELASRTTRITCVK